MFYHSSDTIITEMSFSKKWTVILGLKLHFFDMLLLYDMMLLHNEPSRKKLSLKWRFSNMNCRFRTKITLLTLRFYQRCWNRAYYFMSRFLCNSVLYKFVRNTLPTSMKFALYLFMLEESTSLFKLTCLQKVLTLIKLSPFIYLVLNC